MNEKSHLPTLIFFGTPDFAVASLSALLAAGFIIKAVVTAPDKRAGRGRKLKPSAVKKFAKEQDLPVLQPEKLRSPGFLEKLKHINADIQVVVAFRMLPKVVWDMPPMGTVNVHASLLPKYRGAAPINHAIMNGEPQTGITTFQLKHEIDTGDLLLQEIVAITPKDTFGSLYLKLMEKGGKVLVKSLQGLSNGTISPTPQKEMADCPTAPKIFRGDCRINWENPAKKVYDFIRSLSPHPKAFTDLEGRETKILEADYEITHHGEASGSIKTDNKNYLKIAALEGWINIISIQPPGKKAMPIKSFLNGHKF